MEQALTFSAVTALRASVPWPSVALSTAKASRKGSRDQSTYLLVIKCFHDHSTVESSSTFIFYLYMKVHEDFKVDKSVLHMILKQL